MPLYSKVVHAFHHAKEEALKAAGLKKNKNKKTKKGDTKAARMASREAQKKAAEELRMKNFFLNATPEELAEYERVQAAKAMAAAVQAEVDARRARTAAAADRIARREKAWQSAHQHKFVSIPGEVPFCVVCMERDYDAWLLDYNKEEEKHLKTFDEALLDDLNDIDDALREQVEQEHEALVELMEDRRMARAALESGLSGGEPIVVGTVGVIGAADAWGGEDPELYKSNFGITLFESGVSSLPPRVAKSVVAKMDRKVPTYILMSGLSFVDPHGHNIVPDVVDDEEMADLIDINADEVDDEGNPPLSIKIRVWHWEEGKRGHFMGEAQLNYKVIC